MTERKSLDFGEFQAFLKQFIRERDWNQYHTPKNLAMALSGEVGELVEIFQWLTSEESKKVMESEKTAVRVREEIADVMIYILRMVDVLDIDLNAAVWEKIKKNGAKYPVHLAKGSAKKYSDL